MPRCEACPVASGETCLGDAHPDAFAHLCRWATSDEPNERAMPVLRSAIGYDPPSARPATPTARTTHGPDIPLAGDVVEAVAKRIGADRLAKWWEAKTGVPCGCAGRKEALNRATATLLRWAGMGEGPA